MATIHIDEIKNILLEMGREDTIDSNGKRKIDFLEIRFDDEKSTDNYIVDEQMIDKSIAIETYFASGLIVFDERGCLKSIDFS
jgi:hypothetical protein